MSEWQPFADPWDAPGIGWIVIFVLLSTLVRAIRDHYR